MKRCNLFEPIPEAKDGEIFETLAETGSFKLERIVSRGHATPPGKWYDQDSEEWVVLLRGRAGLLFEGESEIHVMGPGDYFLIPSHRRHRVEWTDPAEETIWLALHYVKKRDRGKAGL